MLDGKFLSLYTISFSSVFGFALYLPGLSLDASANRRAPIRPRLIETLIAGFGMAPPKYPS